MKHAFFREGLHAELGALGLVVVSSLLERGFGEAPGLVLSSREETREPLRISAGAPPDA